MQEWSHEEEELLKMEALEVVKKRDLHWEEDLPLRIDSMIEALEKENSTIDRDIGMMTSIQVDEVRQSFKLLGQTKPEADNLVKIFDELGLLVAAEREDMKDFKQLKEVHETLETLSSVTNTVDMLLSLQQKHVEYEEALQSSGPTISATCTGLWPVHEFKQNLSTASGHPDKQKFSSHFTLLCNTLQSVVGKMRKTFTKFSKAGCEINNLDNNGGDWGKLLDEEFALLSDAMDVVNSERELMFSSDLSLFDDHEKKYVKEGGLWSLCLQWITQGTNKLWVDSLRLSRTNGEEDLLNTESTKTILDRLSEWIKALDGIIFNLIKDGHPEPTPSTLAQGPWKDTAHAEAIVRIICDVGHEMVMRILNLWISRMGTENKLGAPDLLVIVKWTKMYDTQQGILRCYQGFKLTGPAPHILTAKGKQELEEKRALMLRYMSQTLKEWLGDMAERQATTTINLAYDSESGIQRKGRAGIFHTMGPVDFFDLLNTQYDEIGHFKDTSAMESLASGVQYATLQYMGKMKECCKHEWWTDKLAAETFKAPFNGSNHRFVASMALLNDAATFQENLPRIEGRFKTVVQPSKLHFDVAFSEVAELTHISIHEFGYFITISECSEMWDGLFPSPEGSSFPDILATIADYEGDLKTGLDSDKHEKTVQAMGKLCEVEYLKRFAGFCKDDKQKKFEGRRVEEMKTDHRGLVETFEGFGATDIASGAIKLLADITGALYQKVWVSYENHIEKLIKMFPDVPSELVRFLVKKIDLSSSERERATEPWDAMINSQDRDENDVPAAVSSGAVAPTVFSNIRIDTSANKGVMSSLFGKFGGNKNKRKSLQKPGKSDPSAAPPSGPASPANNAPPPQQEKQSEQFTQAVTVGSLSDFLNS